MNQPTKHSSTSLFIPSSHSPANTISKPTLSLSLSHFLSPTTATPQQQQTPNALSKAKRSIATCATPPPTPTTGGEVTSLPERRIPIPTFILYSRQQAWPIYQVIHGEMNGAATTACCCCRCRGLTTPGMGSEVGHGGGKQEEWSWRRGRELYLEFVWFANESKLLRKKKKTLRYDRRH